MTNMPWRALIVEAGEDGADALSDALIEAGALSVTVTDLDAGTPEEQAWFDEPDSLPARPWRNNRIVALFDPDADARACLDAAVAECGCQAPHILGEEDIAEQDWVRLTQAQFEPIRVSARLWIVPSWHAAPDPAAINLQLDPGLAFGTGSHPTTRLCLEWLDAHIQGGETVLDYGCGSGILAIAALKLGAGRAIGVDIDPQAVATARDNAAANGAALEAFVPDAAPQVQADILVANILTNPLKVLAPLLAGNVRQGGALLLAGVLETQAEEVMQAYRSWFDMRVGAVRDGWVRLEGARL
jgi:ribosomal protein L11 methyltransferase